MSKKVGNQYWSTTSLGMWWNDKVDDGVGLKDLSTHESWDVHMLMTRGLQALLVPWVGSIKKWNVGVVLMLDWTTTFGSFIDCKGFWSIHTKLTSQVVSNALILGFWEVSSFNNARHLMV
jgi:hypothetical protein